MFRIVVALLSLALCAAAGAQPAPRVTLDVALQPADGFRAYSQEWDGFGPLAVGQDGTRYVVVYEEPGNAPVRQGRIVVLALAADGTMKSRTAVPTLRKDAVIEMVHVAVSLSGDLVLFLSTSWKTGSYSEPVNYQATLLRFSPELRLKKSSPLPAPERGGYGGARYVLHSLLPTRDNALLAAGGFGGGPFLRWMGKFSLDGVRIWQSDTGRYAPEDVVSVSERPDGSWLSLVMETPAQDLFIRRYSADGKLLTRMLLMPFKNWSGGVALRNGAVVIDGSTGHELIYVDDRGRTLHRAPWPFEHLDRVIPDGDGFAAIVRGTDDARRQVVRVDGRGRVRWLSPVGNPIAIASTPDGQIAALAMVGEDTSPRLVHYADP